MNLAFGVRYSSLIAILLLCADAYAGESASYARNPAVGEGVLHVSGMGIWSFVEGRNEPKWVRFAGVPLHPPLVVEKRLYVAANRVLYALTGETGEQLWSHRFPHPIFAPMRVAGHLFVSDHAGNLHALDSSSGQKAWSRKIGQGWIYPPAHFDGLLILGGQDGMVWAVQADSGKVRWQRSAGQELVFSPLAVGSQGVVVSNFAGELAMFAPNSGERLWRTAISAPGVHLGFVHGLLLVTSMDGKLYAVTIESGQIEWQIQLPSPAIAPVWSLGGGFVVLIDGGRAVRIVIEDGRPVVSQVHVPDHSGAIAFAGYKGVLFEQSRNNSMILPVYLDAIEQ